jgi:hypothetical protein
VATFTLLPGTRAWPLALSTGGGCFSFDRTLRRICFASLPIAVSGRHGLGRFVLFGGPHLFESNQLGLLSHPDNARFLRNTLDWLLCDAEEDDASLQPQAASASATYFPDLSRVEENAHGERIVTSVERVLRKTGVLKALGRAKWMP